MSHQDHCDSNGHHHQGCCSHTHEEEGSCCHSQEGKESHHDSCEGDFARHLLQMADCAWMELLKDKMKEQIESTCGAQLDELAKLVSTSNHERWKHKMAKQKGCEDYKQKVAAFFSNQKC